MGDVMSLRLPCRAALSVIPFFLMTASASAHHVMGGKIPTTFAEGFLSGLGHPVIGPDHLAFLLAIGVAVGVGGLNLVLPLLFVVASAIGVTLHVNGVNLPGAEIVVAVSVLFAGFLIARGRALPVSLWAILFAAAGLFHGYAFGEFYLRGREISAACVPAGPHHRSKRAHRRDRVVRAAQGQRCLRNRTPPGRGGDHRGRACHSDRSTHPRRVTSWPDPRPPAAGSRSCSAARDQARADMPRAW